MTGPEVETSLRASAVERRLSVRRADAEDEVRRLLDVGLSMMREHPTGDLRVATIVRAAGVSNKAFYRSFGGKDELMAAVADDGARRMVSYVRHQRDKSADPGEQVRLAVRAVLHQARDQEAATTARAVLRLAFRSPQFRAAGGYDVQEGLADVLAGPLAALGSTDVERDSLLAACAAISLMEHHLWREQPPSTADEERLVGWILRAGGGD
ncbi:TetR/AcrR family transcriptional regulator [Cryptosporangium aurantiacum]|uniref:Transcriptional regulator, TetR family n=1 Tax=Cryptosporangium aurantiacum TaxID=134849 RepID=A0A1M7PJN3_9ACTN|nr:TetR/AcrR family transcriptional regulator [Cryptosporangium aurantiacum]SHN17285.1 transcriptional regulator, TetR family [Cryptosporangium aurantiacum]